MVLCIVTSSKLKPLLFICISSMLFSCTQQPVKTPATPDSNQHTDVITDGISAQQLYQNAAVYSGEKQQQQLLEASRQAVKEQHYQLALAISENLKTSTYSRIRQQNLLPLMQAYIGTAQYSYATRLLEDIKPEQLYQTDRPAFLWHGAQFFSQQQRHLSAVRFLLQLDAIENSAESYPQQWELLWLHLNALSEANITTLKVGASQRTLAWLALAELSRRYAGQPEQLAEAMYDWQRRYPSMPSMQQLPETVTSLISLQPYQPQNIAVLLPLSGQFRQHAQAIQNGVMAAAGSRPDSKLFFIDSNQDSQTITQQLHSKNIDFVIGPLLREQVEQFSNSEEWQWPTLFLNSKTASIAAKPERFYFALSMEDEASQMAQLFQQKNYQRPVVIYASNNISQRIAQQFSEQWQQAGHSAPEQYPFAAKEELEALVTRLLETDNSKERIREISGLIAKKTESDPYSRLDIDAIYLIADPVQTRLFKPFIDVSVSQTAPRLPVYASSRSHSTGIDRTDQRDLNGLTFTEMPWMLGEQSGLALREQYQNLFPDQDETLQRLFAMGFDAFQLIASLKQQQRFPAIAFPGMTGQLKLTADGTVQRQLSWAGYRNNRLVALQEP